MKSDNFYTISSSQSLAEDPDFDETNYIDQALVSLQQMVAKDTPKEEILQRQLEINALAPGEDVIMPTGDIVHRIHTVAVDSYSTRFLSVDNQLPLAIDKIAFPEVRAGLVPEHHFTSPNPNFCQWNGITFITRFSLNGGDKQSLGILVDDFPYKERERYEITVDPRSLYSGCFDESTTLRNMDKPQPPASTIKTAEDAYRFLARSHAECFMARCSDEELAFACDVYDPEGLSENKDIPTWGVSFYIRQVESGNGYGKKQLQWGYAVLFFSAHIKFPGDMVLKASFEPAKLLMRTTFATLGIHPTLGQK